MFLRYFILLIPLLSLSAEEEAPIRQAVFTPPEGWRAADSASLPKSVKYMVVGKGSHDVPPSINLGYEVFAGSLKDYLKIVQRFNASQGDSWKDLGTIETAGGSASLSQVDVKTEWGPIRQMHLIYKDEGIIYILTAAAARDEFSKFYNLFFQSLRSFHIQTVAR